MMKKTGKKAARKWVLFSFWMTAAAVLPGQIRALAAESLQAGPGPAEMFRAAELPAELAYSDSLHDFTLEIEGQLDIFQTEDTGSASSSNWEENRAVSQYGTDGLTVRGDSHITDTTIFQADGSSQVNEFASQFQYENGVLLRTAVLPFPGSSSLEISPAEYLDLELPDGACVTEISKEAAENGTAVYHLDLNAAAITEKNAHILKHVLHENYQINWAENPEYGFEAGFDEASLQVILDGQGAPLSIRADYIVNAVVQDGFKASGTTVFHFSPGSDENQSGFTVEQLEAIKASLGIPAGKQLEIQQSEPYYWEAGERWLIQVDFYENGNYAAGAAFDRDTLEICANIYMYAG